MIRAIRCDHPSFRSVEFKPGLNVILADRTRESTTKDSRNGLGKSTLIDVIHFCLGAQKRDRIKQLVDALPDWAFTLELTIGDTQLSATRSTKTVGEVRISRGDGETASWRVPQWTAYLGKAMFDLPEIQGTHEPTFRGLISYFARSGKDAYSSPFEHVRKMGEAQKQVTNAYLLQLEWTFARDWQLLKEKKQTLDNLKRAAKQGLIKGVMGSIGELQAKAVQLETRTQKEKSELDSFRVHPQYAEIQQRANEITDEIHELLNENVADDRLARLYRSSITEEKEPSGESVAKLFTEAGVVFAEAVTKRLSDVESFHQQLIRNRRDFLQQEIDRVERAVEARNTRVELLTSERAEQMSILQAHGALDEYNRLHERHVKTESQLRDIEHRLSMLRQVEEGSSSLKIEQELLHKRARQDLDERAAQRTRAIALFNANSEALYEAPGSLVINVEKKGYQFEVEIERSGSQGIENMKIFCYDLMLAQLWSAHSVSPRFLIHDSTIFDGVDERQVAHAIELAARESERHGFQYICAINSDVVPRSDFSADFRFENFVRLRLADDTDEGRLMGIRF